MHLCISGRLEEARSIDCRFQEEEIMFMEQLYAIPLEGKMKLLQQAAAADLHFRGRSGCSFGSDSSSSGETEISFLRP